MSNALMLGNSLVSGGILNDANMAFLQKYSAGSLAPLREMRLRIEDGQDAAAVFIGDSTFRSSVGCPYQFATLLAAKYPTHRVELYQAANNMQSIGKTVVQAGPAGARYLLFPSDAAYNVTLPQTSAIDDPNGTALVSVEWVGYFEASRLTAGKPSANVILGGWGLSGAPTTFLIDTNGVLQFNHRASGGGVVANWPSSVAVFGGTLVAGTQYGFKVTYNPTNGANSVINFYTSTDGGVTWDQLGTANQTTTISSVRKDATDPYWLGSSGGTPSGGFGVYSFNIRIGASQRRILPDRIDIWYNTTGQTSGATEMGGSPTIYIDQAAQDGATLLVDGFFSGSGAGDLGTEAYRCLLNHDPSFICIASSHNDTDGSMLWMEDWEGRMEAAVVVALAQFPRAAPILHSTQNPEPLDYADGGLPRLHNDRQSLIPAYAARKGRGCVDPYQAFVDADNPDYALSDNVHPSTAGYVFWGRTFYRLFLAA